MGLNELVDPLGRRVLGCGNRRSGCRRGMRPSASMAANAGAIKLNPMAAPTSGVSLTRTPVARRIIAAGTALASIASGIDGDLGRNALKDGAMKRRSAFATTPTAKIDARK